MVVVLDLIDFIKLLIDFELYNFSLGCGGGTAIDGFLLSIWTFEGGIAEISSESPSRRPCLSRISMVEV